MARKYEKWHYVRTKKDIYRVFREDRPFQDSHKVETKKEAMELKNELNALCVKPVVEEGQ